MMQLVRSFRRLRGDERGVSAVELALLAPVLAMFVVGTSDLGLAFAERFALQQSIHRGLEMAHQAGAIDDTYEYLEAEIARAANKPVDDVTVTEWLECDGVRQSLFTDSCAADQQIARFVEVRIDCTYDPMFSDLPFSNRNPDGSVPLTARASLRVQ